MVGMNQYFEWQVRLAGGKSAGGGRSESPSTSRFTGSPTTDMDIGSFVPIERVSE